MKLSRKVSYFIKKQIYMLLEPVIGYSRMVSFTKIALLAVAAGLIAVLIIMPFFNVANKNFKISFSSIEKDKKTDLPKMINPHLQGIDGNGQTYNVTAESAVQDKKDKMILKNINANINLKDNGWISVTAEDGLFDHSRSIMDLSGNINVFNHEGYEFSTGEIHADMKNSSLYGNTQIKGQGPIGTIEADNFLVENKGNRIVLTGNVKVVLFIGKK